MQSSIMHLQLGFTGDACLLWHGMYRRLRSTQNCGPVVFNCKLTQFACAHFVFVTYSPSSVWHTACFNFHDLKAPVTALPKNIHSCLDANFYCYSYHKHRDRPTCSLQFISFLVCFAFFFTSKWLSNAFIAVTERKSASSCGQSR